ncbi:YncE family protein [Dictyobacter aurantiacus]|nr:beta-propeller fold lactonase family protein [Dictyobacter aurantiacus]
MLLMILLGACNSSAATNHPAHATSCMPLPVSTAYKPSSSPLTVAVPGHPFASTITSDGQWIFVSLDSSNGLLGSGSLAVLQKQGTNICLLRTIALPYHPLGMALTHDNRLLLVANVTGVAVIDVAQARVGAQGAILGTIQEDSQVHSNAAVVKEAIEVVVAGDDRYAFVSNENDGTVGVLDLQRVRQHDFGSGAVAGQIPVNNGPLNMNSGAVGMAISSDNRYLYVTSRINTDDTSGDRRMCGDYPQGSLAVIDIARVPHDLPHAVLAHAAAGCGPVRVALSSSGTVAWVTAQGSNKVLAFNTAQLRGHADHALLASVPVGSAPTGIILADNDAKVVVTNSNRINNTNSQSATNDPMAPSTLTILDAKSALAGRPAQLGTITVGAFPRELTGTPGGQTLYLTNFNSNTLSLINVEALP